MLYISWCKANLICLFLCWFFRPTREYFTRMETSPLPVKGCKYFDICSATMIMEHWAFVSVPHLLWHRSSGYNGHLWGPVTLTPFAECLVVELRGRDSDTQPSACGATALTHCATAAVKKLWRDMHTFIAFTTNLKLFVGHAWEKVLEFINATSASCKGWSRVFAEARQLHWSRRSLGSFISMNHPSHSNVLELHCNANT